MARTATGTKTEETRSESDRERSLGATLAKSASDASAGMVRDGGRVIEAWGEAAAEYWVGSLRNVGDLVSDLSDAMDRRADRRTGRERDDRLGVDLVRGMTDLASDVSRSVNDALRRSTRVLESSFDRFSEVLDQPRDDREGDASGRRAKAAAQPKATAEEPGA